MSTPDTLINALKERYIPGQVDRRTTYYFHVDDHRYTLVLLPDRMEIVDGKPQAQADVVVKCTGDLFRKVFVEGGMPGPLDLARGRFKTNDPDGLRRLARVFRK